MAQGEYSQLSKILVFFLQLQHHIAIERTELSTNHVLVYLEKVSVHLGLEWVRETQAWRHLATQGKRHGPQNYHGSDKSRNEFHTDFCPPFKNYWYLPPSHQQVFSPFLHTDQPTPAHQPPAPPVWGKAPGFPLAPQPGHTPRQGPGHWWQGEHSWKEASEETPGETKADAEAPLNLPCFPSPAEPRDLELFLHGGAGHPCAGPEASSGEGL